MSNQANGTNRFVKKSRGVSKAPRPPGRLIRRPSPPSSESEPDEVPHGQFSYRRPLSTSGRQPTGLSSLPDELLRHIFELVHASYQHDKPGVPPLDILRTSYRVRRIVRPIWFRTLCVPSGPNGWRADAYLAGIEQRLDPQAHGQRLIISLDMPFFRLALQTVARLSELKHLIVTSLPADEAQQSAALIALNSVIEQLPSLSHVEVPRLNSDLAETLNRLSFKRPFRLSTSWANDALILDSTQYSMLTLSGTPSASMIPLLSLRSLELSLDQFDEAVAGAVLNAFRCIQSATPFPLKHLRLEICDRALISSQYGQLLATMLETLCALFSDEQIQTFVIVTRRAPNIAGTSVVPSATELTVGRRYVLGENGQLEKLRLFIASFPNVQDLVLDSLYYCAPSTGLHLAPSSAQRFQQLFADDQIKRAIAQPFLIALVASLVPTLILRVIVRDKAVPGRELHFTRPSTERQFFEAENWTVE